MLLSPGRRFARSAVASCHQARVFGTALNASVFGVIGVSHDKVRTTLAGCRPVVDVAVGRGHCQSGASRLDGDPCPLTPLARRG